MVRSRRLGIAIVALLVAGALVWGFWPRPLAVEVAPVVRGPLTEAVEEEGRTRVRDRYTVSTPVAGYLRRITLEEGDALTAGQVVAVLEPLRPAVLDPRQRAEAEARVSAAEAALHAAEQKARAAAAETELAQMELTRLEKLRAKGHVSQDEVDRARTRLRSAQASERAARFAVEQARDELAAARAALAFSPAGNGQPAEELVRLRTPVAGAVLRLVRKAAGVVQAGQALLEVGDPRRLEVVAEVLSEDAVKIRPGTPVVFERWGGDAPLRGQVRRVEAEGFTKISALGVEEQRVEVISDILTDPQAWSSLAAGYRVEARFILWQGDDVLQVPAGALFRVGDRWAVFAIEDGRAQRRLVELGHRSGLAAEVVDGLAEGDRVIVHPDDRIEAGVRVEPSS